MTFQMSHGRTTNYHNRYYDQTIMHTKKLEMQLARTWVPLTDYDEKSRTSNPNAVAVTQPTIRLLSALYYYLKDKSSEPDLNEVLKMLRGSRILELGSGHRGVVHILEALGVDAELFALDIVTPLTGKRVTAITGDAFTVDTPPGIDFVISNGLFSYGGIAHPPTPLETYRDMEGASHELARIMLDKYNDAALAMVSIWGVLSLDPYRFAGENIATPIWALSEGAEFNATLRFRKYALQQTNSNVLSSAWDPISDRRCSVLLRDYEEGRLKYSANAAVLIRPT